MREATLILPWSEFDPLNKAVFDVEKHLCAAFGGCTSTPSYGFWRNAEGETVGENVRVITVAGDMDNPENISKLFDVAHSYKMDAEQQEVYLKVNDQVYMVGRE